MKKNEERIAFTQRQEQILSLGREKELTPKPGIKDGKLLWWFYGPSPIGLASPDPGMDDDEAWEWLQRYDDLFVEVTDKGYVVIGDSRCSPDDCLVRLTPGQAIQLTQWLTKAVDAGAKGNPYTSKAKE
jgi:hypothetical protein